MENFDVKAAELMEIFEDKLKEYEVLDKQIDQIEALEKQVDRLFEEL